MARGRFRSEWVRRGVQAASFVAFVALTVGAERLTGDLLYAQLFSRLDPLVGLTAVVASRALVAYALLGVLGVALGVLFGRVWCGWACPVGAVLDVVPARRRHVDRRTARTLRFGKYATFALVMGAALFGTLAPMILDPVTIAMRPLQELAMPALGNDAMGAAVGSSISRDAIALVGYMSILPLLLVVATNLVSRRFWCSSLCPLGGLLAVLSKAAVLRRHVDPGLCVSCGKCARECPTAAIRPEEGYASDPGECVVCRRCADTCPSDAISWEPGAGRGSTLAYAPERREAVAAAGAGAATLGLTLVLPGALPAGPVLRPPGTDERRLAELCVRCGACYSACPTGALRPSTSLRTLSGLWTPMLDERPAHCSLDCNLCAEVCPTDALHTPTRMESLLWGLGGSAAVDRGRCLAWSRGRQCMACQRVCPIMGALTSQQVTVVYHGRPRTVPAPVVDRDLCVACDVCAAACPVMPPAIGVPR